ncbi:MAG: glycoside hydrolase family 55 protein [Opitutales bacterium]
MKTILLSLIFLSALLLRAENIVFPPDSAWRNVKTVFGAKGDGVTDDTAALQRAVDETKGQLRMLYFPNGTYVVSEPIGIFDGKPHSRDRFLSWQGQSRDGVIIKLRDNAPAFQDAAKPRPVISVYTGQSTGDVMQSYFQNFTVDVGSGNPGASGVRFFTNNVGTMEHVRIVSSDPNGAGAVGLDLSQSQNGPGLIRHIRVEGFDRGILGKNSFSLVLEHIDLVGQRLIGVDNEIARMAFRKLTVDGAPVAIRNGQHADLFVFDAAFKTAASDQAAVQLAGSRVFFRDLSQSGYAALIKDEKGRLAQVPSLREWGPARYALFGDREAAETLRLPVLESPMVPWEEDLSKWFTFEISRNEEDISDALQAAIDQAALEGKTTLYFTRAFRKPLITKPIRVHGSVKRIYGFNSEVNVRDPHGHFKDGKTVFTLENLKTNILVVERFFLLGGWDCPAHIVMLDNQTDAAVHLKSVGISGQMKKPKPGGLWFIDDVSPSRQNTLRIGKGERVYARQFNPESPKAPMIDVDGGLLWVFGLKTEGRATHVEARNGAKVEILGGVSYQSWGGQPIDPPILVIENSDLSASFGFYHHNLPFTNVVSETVNGETRILPRSSLSPYVLPVYRTAK